jgi:cytoskeletal protein CcmA (bactofilin family)
MAKGLAVISGSNAVVFKALENGVVQMGGSGSWGATTARVTISGSLTLSGSGGAHLHVSGSDFILQNLSGQPDKIVISGSSLSAAQLGMDQRDGVSQSLIGSARRSEQEMRGGLVWSATSSIAPEMSEATGSGDAYLAAIDSENQYEMPEDFLVITKEGEVRRVNKIDASAVMLNDGRNVEQQVGGLNLNLKHSASDGTLDEKDVNLTRGNLVFKDKEYRTVLSMSNDDNGESVEILVDLDPNLRVETLSASAGLTVTGSSLLKGDLHVVSGSGASGDATIDGKLTVKGDLEVQGNMTQLNVEQKNLVVDDAVILVGSGSDGSTDDLGLVFGTSNRKAFTVQDGDFILGATTGSAQGINIDNDASGKLILQDLSASNLVQARRLEVSGPSVVRGDLGVSGSVKLGDSTSDVISIAGSLTASNGVRVIGDSDLDGDLDVQGATNLQGAATLESTLEVDGAAKLNDSLQVTGSALLKDTLQVKGAAKLDSSLEVTGAVSMDDTLRVKGAATFDSTVDMTGSLTVAQSASIDGDLTVGGTTTLGDAASDKLRVNAELHASASAFFGGDIEVNSGADVTLKAGSDLTLDQGDLTMTDGAALISGSLTLTGSSADPLVVQGLTHHDTASVSGHDIVVIDDDGKVSRASMISASQIAVLPDGNELTSSDAQSAINELQNHINSLSLRIGTGSNAADSTVLKDGGMVFTHQNSDGSDDGNLDISISTIQNSNGDDIVKVNIDLNSELSASSLSASQFVTADTLTASNGLKVSAGGFDVTGDSQLTGDLTIVGDLLVQGTTTVENRNVTTSNMIIEDRIIVVGSGSDPSQAQVGLQLGGRTDDGRVYALGTQPSVEAGTLFLGYTSDSNDHLENVFSSSIDVEGFKFKTGDLELQNSAVINDALTVYGLSHLYNNLTVAGTGSFQDDLFVDGKTVLRGQLHLTGAANFDSDLDLAGSGSIHGDFTVDGKSTLIGAVNISGAVDVSSSLNVEGIVTLGNTLEVDGAVTLNSSLTTEGAVTLKSAVTLGADDNSINYQGSGSAQTIEDNLVKVNGPFRAPIFTHDGVGHPQVPAAWCSAEPQMDYEGYMFYLKGNAIPNSPFVQGNKWYFNENGYWHSSFFWQE